MTGAYATSAEAALDSMRTWLATDPRDWSLDRTDARLWAVLFGWDGGPDGAPDEDAWGEVAARHGWDEEYVAALKARRQSLARSEEVPR